MRPKYALQEPDFAAVADRELGLPSEQLLNP